MGPRRPALPAPVVPMLATAGPVPTGAGWSFEFKWDGVRGLVAVDPGGPVRATSRNLREITHSYPELLKLADLVDRRLVLDGEFVALDEHGRPSFPLLAHRMHVQAPTASLLARIPVQYYVFDLLQIDDTSLLTVPLLQRREQLADLDLNTEGLVRTPPHYTDITGPDLLDVARDNGLEGVIAKRTTSLYYPGKRSPAWIKTPLRNTQEVIIGGWTEGGGRRSGTLGALLLGVHDHTGNPGSSNLRNFSLCYDGSTSLRVRSGRIRWTRGRSRPLNGLLLSGDSAVAPRWRQRHRVAHRVGYGRPVDDRGAGASSVLQSRILRHRTTVARGPVRIGVI